MYVIIVFMRKYAYTRHLHKSYKELFFISFSRAEVEALKEMLKHATVSRHRGHIPKLAIFSQKSNFLCLHQSKIQTIGQLHCHCFKYIGFKRRQF